MTAQHKQATFGAGCFWGVEEAFRGVDGVIETVVGFMGGRTENPTYEEVCRDDTGHAEVVQVTFDPSIISYEKLLDTFWNTHDPTQVNRQGPDVGSQYRSVIFYHTDEQHKAAEASKERKEEEIGGRVATFIEPAQSFFKAEEYHQKYSNQFQNKS